ncbi:MAG: sugar phosphate isomerase/epimerase family protein [Candidatus Hodarchaeota archaeon]
MDHKISVLTDEFKEPDFEKVAEYLSSQDFEYVELRGVWIKNVFNLDDMDIAELKDIFKDTGLKVSSISGGLMKTQWPGPKDEPEDQNVMDDGTPIVEYQLKMADNCIKIADELDIKYIRAFGFHKLAIFEDEMWPDWFDAMKQLIKKVKDAGKTIIIENEAGCIVSDVASIERTFNELKSDNCRLLFDPGNLLAGGEHVTPEVFEKVKELTEYIHVKDWKGKWCIIGEGDVGWKTIAEMFVNDGYDSFWSVETHMGKENAWDNTVKDLKALREILSSL